MSLTASQVSKLGPGRHADGDGLYMLVKPTGARSWLLRVQQEGKRRDIGLGSVEVKTRIGAELVEEVSILHRRVLTLGEARDKASLLRKFAKAGRDPILERDRDRGSVPTFKEAVIACHAELKAGWTPKSAASFLSSLEEHAYKPLGRMRVDSIEASHIRDALAPIWNDIPVMAQKVRQRIGTVLNFSKASGWRTTEAPGKSVTVGLSRQVKGGNFAAMPHAEVPAFVRSMSDRAATAGRTALLFLIFTAARSGEVRSARWSHIDFEKRLWSRPANLMKSREAHTVTLNDQAIELLRRLDAERLVKLDGLIFSGVKGKQLSDMTLSKVLRDCALPYTPHGFRSSFRDWAAEEMPSIPDAVAEVALAHAVSDKVVAAYKRTDFLEMRRKLLDAWGRYAAGADIVAHLKAVA
jgi:integrase